MAHTNPYQTPKAPVAETSTQSQPVKVFSVSGRIGRVRYIAYTSAACFLFLTLSAFTLSAGSELADRLFALAMVLAMLTMCVALSIQRCHDFNASGWLAMLFLVPAVNLALFAIPGSDGSNRYGPPTVPNSLGAILTACILPSIMVLIGVVLWVISAAMDSYYQEKYRKRSGGLPIERAVMRCAIARSLVKVSQLS